MVDSINRARCLVAPLRQGTSAFTINAALCSGYQAVIGGGGPDRRCARRQLHDLQHRQRSGAVDFVR